MGEWRQRSRWTGRPVPVPLDRVRWAQTQNSWGWSGRRDSNPRRLAWKAGTDIYTAWKQRTPLNPALLIAVQYTAENTAVAKGLEGFLPRHALQLYSTMPRSADQLPGAYQPHAVSRDARTEFGKQVKISRHLSFSELAQLMSPDFKGICVSTTGVRVAMGSFAKSAVNTANLHDYYSISSTGHAGLRPESPTCRLTVRRDQLLCRF
jgi:hypothetical protein